MKWLLMMVLLTATVNCVLTQILPSSHSLGIRTSSDIPTQKKHLDSLADSKQGKKRDFEDNCNGCNPCKVLSSGFRCEGDRLVPINNCPVGPPPPGLVCSGSELKSDPNIQENTPY